jgi:hypothetical protein
MKKKTPRSIPTPVQYQFLEASAITHYILQLVAKDPAVAPFLQTAIGFQQAQIETLNKSLKDRPDFSIQMESIAKTLDSIDQTIFLEATHEEPKI